MHGAEIRRLIGKVERAGYTLVPLDLHFSRGHVKLAVGLAKGKRQFEKRDEQQKKDWKREQSRLLKQRTR
jgi:SsrA-binding protein